MSSNFIPQENQSSVLLKIYKERVCDEIYKDLLKEAEPRLRKAAAEMVEGMDVEIRQTLSDRSRQLIVQIELSINGEQAKVVRNET